MRKLMTLLVGVSFLWSAVAWAEPIKLFQVSVESYDARSALRKAHRESMQQAIGQFMTPGEARAYVLEISSLIMDQPTDKFVTAIKIDAQEELDRNHKYTISVTVNMEALKTTIESLRVDIGALEKLATNGDLETQKKLGLIYFVGKNVLWSYEESAKWYRMAAEQGDAMARLQLGNFYSAGLGVEKDENEAMKWFQLAVQGLQSSAAQGDANAQFNLGRMYFQQEQGALIYADKAMEWLRLAAEQGHVEAKYTLGWIYDQGLSVKKDKNEAMKWYRAAAEQGHIAAEHQLGLRYGYGRGVKKDKNEAVKRDVKEWQKLATAGDQEARYVLGTMYDNGQGIHRDYAESMKWYRLAAEQGHAEAQYALGRMYSAGKGIPWDFAEAVKWYRLAAEQGLPIAQNELGLLYDLGMGVQQDAFEALKWYRAAVKGFRVAAEQGDAVAQLHMGRAYGTNDKGVRRDKAEAARWKKAAVEGFRAAAEQGDAEAQFHLGWMYSLRRRADIGWDNADTAGVSVTKDITLDPMEPRYQIAAVTTGSIASQILFWDSPVTTKKDKAESLKWYKAAAEQGHPGAIEILASRYYRGWDGDKKDKKEARRLLQKGVAQGLTKPQGRLDDWFWHCELPVLSFMMCSD